MSIMREFDLMRQFDWQLWAMGGLLVFIGIMIGIVIGAGRRPRKARQVQDAPVPVCRTPRRGDVVRICGAEWTIM